MLSLPLNFSIHKINLQGMHIKTLPKNCPLEKLIDLIIDVYNKKKDGQKDLIYEKIDFPEKNWKPEEHFFFHLQIYFSKRKTISSFSKVLHSLEAYGDFCSSTIHFLVFMYRTIHKTNHVVREIFALTTNKAWEVIHPYEDFSFSLKIARRIAFPKFSSSGARELAGAKISSSLIYREGYSLGINEQDSLGRIVNHFKAPLKKKCSLFYRIPSLTKKTNKTISLEVGLGMIRLGKKLPLNEYLKMLDLFSTIDHGEKTFRGKNQKKEEIDDPEFLCLENIRPAEYHLIKTLETKLHNSLWICFSKKNASSLSFVHHFYQDFFSSTYFRLQDVRKKSKRSKDIFFWYYPPTVVEIMQAINQKFGNLGKASFFVKLQQLSMNYGKKSYPLLEFFEAEILHEGNLYLKINKVWQKIVGEYCSIIQRAFYELLKKCYLSEMDIGYLSKPWISKMQWASFSEDTFRKIEENTLEEYDSDEEMGLNALKQERFSFISKDGTVWYHKLSPSFLSKLPPKKRKTWKKNIETLLQENKKVQVKDFEKFFNKKKAIEIFQYLQETYPFLDQVVPSKLVMASPVNELSANTWNELSQKEIDFLQNQHDQYLSEKDEEEYNRSFLFEKKPFGCNEGYLVCDQIFPSKREKIELFDVAYYTKTHLFLYHIKEGFGQTTRDACSQLRVAAKNIYAALRNKSTILKKLYKTAIKDPNSSFRKKVKMQFESLGEENFLNLFTTKKIVFVYAFLDTHVKEKHIHLEKNPGYFFQKDDLPENDLYPQKNLLQLLKNTNYLDSRGRLTEKFLTSTKKEFLQNFLPPQNVCGFKALAGTVFDCLSQKICVFSSMIAKVELLELRKTIEDEFGFSFKICQIPRYKTSPNNLFQKTIESNEMDIDEDLTLSLFNIFEYQNKWYRAFPNEGKGSCALYSLYGEDLGKKINLSQNVQQHTAIKKYYVDTINQKLRTPKKPLLIQLLKERFYDFFIDMQKSQPQQETIQFFKDSNMQLYLNNYKKEILQVQQQRSDFRQQITSHYYQIFNIQNTDFRNQLFPILKTTKPEFNTFQSSKDFFPFLKLKEQNFLYFQNIFEAAHNNLGQLIQRWKDNKSLHQNDLQILITLHQQLNGYNSELKKLNDLEETICTKYIYQEKVFQKYLLCVVQPDFYFHALDLKIAAFLETKKVILLPRDIDEKIEEEHIQIFGKHLNQPPIYIVHQGIHFERAALIE